ncbi:MAG: hypothetical protein M0C28_21765 [Candidatus Moduliflexus flocculans]|nr:hypothetical protein [Candidatus Moduliflexus flocculans]
MQVFEMTTRHRRRRRRRVHRRAARPCELGPGPARPDLRRPAEPAARARRAAAASSSSAASTSTPCPATTSWAFTPAAKAGDTVARRRHAGHRARRHLHATASWCPSTCAGDCTVEVDRRRPASTRVDDVDRRARGRRRATRRR